MKIRWFCQIICLAAVVLAIWRELTEIAIDDPFRFRAMLAAGIFTAAIATATCACMALLAIAAEKPRS